MYKPYKTRLFGGLSRVLLKGRDGISLRRRAGEHHETRTQPLHIPLQDPGQSCGSSCRGIQHLGELPTPGGLPRRKDRLPAASSMMEHRSSSQLLLSFTLFSVLCSPALALPPLGTYSAMSRLGNRMPFDAASEPDQAQGSLKPETDILQNALPENDKFYLDMSRALDRNARHADGLFTSGYSKLLGQLSARRYLESLIGKRVSNNLMDEQMPVKRHSDAVFTDNYSRFRKQMAVKKYLNSILTGKRSQEELNPASLRDEAELLEPSFSETYDDVTVDELLNRLPLSL